MSAGERNRLTEPAYSRRTGLHSRGEPYQQGELDGLCGLYSAVNALALLVARGKRLSTATCTDLFQRGLSTVGADTSLEHVVGLGMDPELWLGIIETLADQLGRKLGLHIAVERPFEAYPHVGFGQIRRTIEAAVDRGAVVPVVLLGTYNHYTVIAAHSPTRFLLHDSARMRWLSKAACGSTRSRRRHQIAPPWVVVLSVDCEAA